MTPDVLPADVTGTQVYRETTGEFEFRRGPVFANVVVADEINRATPKTQSALLESMQEQTVTVGGETLSLPEPFIVIATQNPIEYEGTFALPEAQRDRFQLKLSVSAPERRKQLKLLDRFDDRPELSPDDITQSVSREQLLTAQAIVRDVYVATPVKEYIIDIIEATNNDETLTHGCSPRAAISLLSVAKAEAALQNRQYVIPGDVKSLATETLAHRVVLGTDAELSDLTTNSVLEDIMTETPTPEDIDPKSESESKSDIETNTDTESSIHDGE
jgi:MoxR-like ATPase